MSYGLKIKNSRGELVTDEISDIGQHINTGVATINGYSYVYWDTSTYSNSLNLTLIPSVRSNWASPWVRRYDKDKIYAMNRLWYTLSPAPSWRVSMIHIGTGTEDVSSDPYGFRVKETKYTDTINSRSRTLRWVSMGEISFAGTTITGAYDDWVCGPYTVDISSLNFKTPPFVVVSPMDYVNVTDGAEYSRYAVIWYVSTTEFNFGTYLLQSAGFELVAYARNYFSIFLVLD